jgi:hypothetical protein
MLIAIGVLAGISALMFFFAAEPLEEPEPEAPPFDAFADGYPVPPMPHPPVRGAAPGFAVAETREDNA